MLVNLKKSSSRVLLVAMCAAFGAYLTGCTNSREMRDPCRNNYYFGPPGCFGHYSTCWRAWPEECVACPSYAQGEWATAEEIPEGAKTPDGSPRRNDSAMPEDSSIPEVSAIPEGSTIPEGAGNPKAAEQPEDAAADEVQPDQSLPPIIDRTPRKAPPAAENPSSSNILPPIREFSSRRTQVVPAGLVPTDDSNRSE